MQPEFGRPVRIVILLLVAVPAWAQEQPVGPVETEAPEVAGLVSTEPVASDALVEEARSALRLIRGVAPELAWVRFSFFFAPGELLCRLGEDLQARLRQHTGKLSEFDFRDEVMNDLRDRYPLQSIREVTPNLAKIRFAETSGRYNLALLREKLLKSKVLFSVTRNFYSDSEYRLDPRKIGAEWLIVVERGRSFGEFRKRADDPVEYWYFRVAGGKAEVVERIRGSDMGRPRVYRWGVPLRLAVSVYPTLEKLVETAQNHPEWWHRTHAMQAAARLLTSAGIGVGEDDARQYAVLREAALKRREALLDLLIGSLSDINAAIREGARSALEVIFGEEHGEDPKAWTKRRKGGD